MFEHLFKKISFLGWPFKFLFGWCIPKGLMGRFLTILLLPLVLLQVVSFLIFYDNHWDNVTKKLTATLQQEISVILDLHAREKDTQTPPLLSAQEIAKQLRLNFKVIKDPVPFEISRRSFFDRRYPFVQKRLTERLEQLPVTSFDLKITPQTVAILLQKDQENFLITLPLKQLFTSSTYIFMLWVFFSSIFLFGIASLFLRNQIRSISQLSEAANSFGRSQPSLSYKPSGPREVRRAGVAFLRMKNRLEHQGRERTKMLSSVSHDLRTPLTRMKLQLALLNDSSLDKNIGQDLEEMESLVESYLTYARDEKIEEGEEIDLTKFMHTFIQNFRGLTATSEENLRLIAKERIRLFAYPKLLKRALNNSVHNAFKYADTVWITVTLEKGYAAIYIEDNGPGIPEHKRKEMLRPFARGEESRNKKTGGVGLGLSIVNDCVSLHNGYIKLLDSRFKGLKVALYLPTSHEIKGALND